MGARRAKTRYSEAAQRGPAGFCAETVDFIPHRLPKFGAIARWDTPSRAALSGAKRRVPLREMGDREMGRMSLALSSNAWWTKNNLTIIEIMT
ncbi:unnamed protein product [Euphydryas editha]|uniref:Uncharacterized protein n=1 Tax=Euphydryas editha TaxID=104508 RepID=A0AAU9TLX1_EUPED|nr:unnamed protein product [Euphydryas editha]